MDGIFEERERGYEAKWAHDQTTLFAIMANRNRWLGMWAAEMMKLSSVDAEKYAQEIIEAGLRGKGQDPVFEKLRSDLASRHVGCSDTVIHHKMRELFEKAGERTLKKSTGS